MRVPTPPQPLPTPQPQLLPTPLPQPLGGLTYWLGGDARAEVPAPRLAGVAVGGLVTRRGRGPSREESEGK